MAWLSGVGNTLIQSTITLRLPRCGNRRIYHFICEVPAMVKLACVNIRANEVQLFMASLVLLLLPLTLILISYGCIAQAVMRIRSAQAWRKALGTCGSHLLVVTLFYGTITAVYIQPNSSYAHSQGKFITLLYTVVTPTLNPLIYTLRNKDVKGALKKLVQKDRAQQIECILLAVMSYDRFSAVCRPLHYMTIMNSQLCQGLVGTAWVFGVINCMILSPYAMSLPRCGNHHLDHFFCEMSAMIKIACVDTTAMEVTTFAMCLVIVLVPLLLILVSYGFIAVAVLKIKSATGRQKAFGTCSSHLIVVSIFYGTVIYMYIQPGNSPNQNEGKLLSIFYSIVTPSMNPLIYTLRNKEFKGAVKRLIGKKKVLWKQ
ncbi:hypothetical protein MJT46_017161 [Ovis ammon polii x Ovis aries]|nr:hypothetical protein MJT46_017161 [Ovis ammon polii x Ovis aries]